MIQTTFDSIKRCTKCNRWLDKSQFWKDKTRKDDLQHRCISCIKNNYTTKKDIRSNPNFSKLRKDIDYVICEICGIAKKQLTDHLWSIHKLSIKQYNEIFPDALITCNELKKRLSDSKKRWSITPDGIIFYRELTKLNKEKRPETVKKYKQWLKTPEGIENSKRTAKRNIDNNPMRYPGAIEKRKLWLLSPEGIKFQKKGFNYLLKNQPWSFMGINFLSKQEKEIAKLRFHLLGIIPINGENCHIMVQRYEFDFKQLSFIHEHHPEEQWNRFDRLDEYYQNRKKILNKNNCHLPLIVTTTVNQAERLYAWLAKYLTV